MNTENRSFVLTIISVVIDEYIRYLRSQRDMRRAQPPVTGLKEAGRRP